MGYRRFEELPVWKDAIELADRVYQLTDNAWLDRRRGLRDQVERAGQSISNNIAEGFDRGTHAELVSFLYIALGSASELRSMTYSLERLSPNAETQNAINEIRELSCSISRQLGGWLESLKREGQRGPRDRTPEARRQAAQQKRASQFDEELHRIRREHGLPEHPRA